MEAIAPAAFAFLVGLTVAGIVATLTEIVTDEPLCFAEPHLSPSRIVRSVALTAVAGPFMLGNEALSAFRRGTINSARLVVYGLVGCTWALSLGVLALAFAATMVDFFA